MPNVIVDVIGLVLYSAEHQAAFFVDARRPRISQDDKPIPPHVSFIAVPTGHHTVNMVRRSFDFHLQPFNVHGGRDGEHTLYLLFRTLQDDIEQDTIDRVSIPGAKGGSAHTIPDLLDIRDVLKDPLPADTVRGRSRSVGAILYSQGASARAEVVIANQQLEFGGRTRAYGHVLRLTYYIPDEKEALVLLDSQTEQEQIVLGPPQDLGGGVHGWHLLAGNIPLEDLFNIDVAHGHTHGPAASQKHDHQPPSDLHHFEVLYDLYFGNDPRRERPLPKVPPEGPPLGPPGWCGPPAQGG